MSLIRLCFLIISGMIVHAVIHAKTINAADFGLKEGMDGTPAIIQAMNAARTQKAERLIIPKGKYVLKNEKALEQYFRISNNDNSLNRKVFSIIGFENFEIDGQGSDLVFEGPMVPFVIEQSKNITIKNLSIDWKQPFYGQGEVIASNEKARTFDLKIDGEFTYEIHHKRLYFKTARGFHNKEQNIFFYPNGGSTVYNVNAYKLDPWGRWANDLYEAEEIAENTVRIKTLSDNLIPQVGWIWVAKGRNGERRSPAIRVYRSLDVHFDGVSIYHSSGMGLVGEKSGNISIHNMTVKPTPGSSRAISTTADATHFVNCKGEISVVDSYFSNMMDDAINVHGIYTKIVDLIDEKTVGVRQVHFQQFGFDFAESGDEVEFIDNDTLLPVGRAVVKEYRWFNEEYQELVFDRPVMKWIKLNFGIENITWSAAMTFKNNVVEKNRARGVLFSTRKPVLVEGNTFSSMMAGISISGDVNFWYESGPSNGVTIRNNHFIDCTSGGKGNAVIMIAPIMKHPERAEGYYNRDFVIEGNTIEAFDKAVLYALSVDGLRFTDNTIIHSKSYESIFPEKTTLEIMGSKNVIISGNTFNRYHNGDLLTDRKTLNEIKFEENTARTGETNVKAEAENKYNTL